jgi:hypothetical protein
MPSGTPIATPSTPMIAASFSSSTNTTLCRNPTAR